MDDDIKMNVFYSLPTCFDPILLNITFHGRFCNLLVYGKTLLANVKYLVNIPPILIFLRTFALPFEMEMWT